MGGSKPARKQLYLKYLTLKLNKEINLIQLISDLENAPFKFCTWRDIAEILLNCEE